MGVRFAAQVRSGSGLDGCAQGAEKIVVLVDLPEIGCVWIPGRAWLWGRYAAMGDGLVPFAGMGRSSTIWGMCGDCMAYIYWPG